MTWERSISMFLIFISDSCQNILSKPLKCSILVINLIWDLHLRGFLSPGWHHTILMLKAVKKFHWPALFVLLFLVWISRVLHYVAIFYPMSSSAQLFRVTTIYHMFYPTLGIFSTWYWGIQYATADVFKWLGVLLQYYSPAASVSSPTCISSQSCAKVHVLPKHRPVCKRVPISSKMKPSQKFK